MNRGDRFFALRSGRWLLLCVLALACSCVGASAQVATQGDPGTVGGEPAIGSEPPATAADAAKSTARASALPNQSETQGAPFQTSAQQQVDQGLIPTLDSGEATSAFANGIVSTFPGLTSFGGRAAAAAANSSKFLTVYANQSVAYSDNPGQIGAGQVSSSFIQSLDRPDFYEVTSGGVLLSKTISLQNFFASANFGVTNYAHDSNFNSTRYSFSAGDNYAIGDVCAGTIVGNASQSAVPLEFTTGSLAAQDTQNESGEASSRCKVTGHIYTTTDLRASRSSFTNAAVEGNDSNQLLGSVGLEYLRPSFLTMGVMASVQETRFTGRNTLLLGLSDQTSQIDFNAFVSKPISPKLNVSLSAGIADLTAGSPSLSGTVQPIYSATVTYAYSPKTSLYLNYARLVGSPQSFVSDFQQIETIAAGVNYRYSVKTSVSATVSHSTTNSGGVSGALSQLLANSETMSEGASINYKISRGASAALSYQHTSRESGVLFGPANANIVSLSISYRR